jgi:hypothetical protein
VAAIVGAASSALAHAAPAPSGDSAAISFYGREAGTYAHLAGAKMLWSGFFFVRPGVDKGVDYWWGSKPPAGYTPATATVAARLSDGKIVAYLAQLTAPKVRRLRILMAGGAVFTSTTRCWKKSQASVSPFGTGERFIFNDGGAHFAPRSGNRVTMTYQWAPGATATETTSFNASDPPGVDVSIEVGGRKPLSIHKSIRPLTGAPALPIPSPPLRPAPKPLCS